MPTSDPITILLAQNRWATSLLLDACSTLSEEQFHQAFDMGPGSLHDTITHVLGAMQGWGDLLAGREQRPRLEGLHRTVDELRELLATIADDLASSAAAHPLDESVTGERGGRSFTFQRGAVLTHVLTHGMHHRAQGLNMLRRLGVSELPPAAVIEWVMMGEPGV